MRCEACGALAAPGARCAICGHSLPPAERLDAGRAASPLAIGETFVGRVRELAILRAALDEALAGRGRVVLLVGEPGIGKTRLAAEVAALARARGTRVLTGRAGETDGAPPYWPWAQIIRAHLASEADGAEDLGPHAEDLARLMPDLATRPAVPAEAGPAAEQARFRLFESFARFLDTVARRRPLMLVLDDLHWFDAPSLRLLEFAARALGESPVLILGAYREAGLHPEHTLLQVVGALVREPACESVSLGGLTAPDVARFVESATSEPAPPSLVKAVLQETEGNPFFIAEILRLILVESSPHVASTTSGIAPFPVPHGVRAAIGRRLQGVSAPCRKVLILAAVLGREFGAAALERLGADYGLGPTGDWLIEVLEEAVDARLIAVVPQAVGRYGFTHALIRETLYEELNPARRARLHRDIAQVLERLAGAQPDRPPAASTGAQLAELAYHHVQAIAAGGDVDRAIAYALQAGDWAMTVLAYEDAVTHYRRALETLAIGGRDDPRQGDVLLRLGAAHDRAGEIEHAQEAFERTIALARRLRGAAAPPEAARLFARAALGLGGEWWLESGQLKPRYIDLLEEALSALDPVDSDLRALVQSRLAVALYYVPDAIERRLALSEEALAMARRVGDPVTLALALGGRHWALWEPARLDERLAVSAELLRLTRQIGARELVLQARVWRLGDLLERGDLDAVDVEIDAFARLAAELRQPAYEWWTPMFRAMRALLEGRLAEAERLAEEGLALGQRVHGVVSILIFGSYLVWVRRAQGRIAELEAAVKGMVDQNPSEVSLRSVLAWVCVELGHHVQAREELDRLAARSFADLPRDLRFLPMMAMLTQVTAFLSDTKRAAMLYDLLLPHADLVIVSSSGAGPCLGAASRFLGVLAATLGRWDEAERHFEHALALNKRLRSRPLTAFVQQEYGAMLMRRDGPGDRARGADLVAAALTTARELGMSSLRERIEAAGAEPAVAPRPRRSPSPAIREEPGSPARPPAAPTNIFRRDGEYWTLVYQGEVSRLKDAKGLRYLAALVHQPDREFHVLDLAALTDPRPREAPRDQITAELIAEDELRVGGPGDKGAPLDAQARNAYRQRVADLRGELREAERFNDGERAARLREEIDFLSGELSAAYGIGGRARKRAGGEEQVRKNVTNCIRNSVQRIGRSNAPLARHLLAAVRTGVFCSYRPEPAVTWDS